MKYLELAISTSTTSQTTIFQAKSLVYSDYSNEIRPRIYLSNDESHSTFNENIGLLLNKIALNPIGKKLLDKISLLVSKIFIETGSKDETYAEVTPAAKTSIAIIFITLKDLECYSTHSETISIPNHVVLFHELTHAYHCLSGRNALSNKSDPLIWTNDEEYKTIIGFPSKCGKTTPKITENAFRQAEGLPLRYGSFSPNKNIRSLLAGARGKILGKIYEAQLLKSPNNLSPPPMTQHSIELLGPDVKSLSLFTFKEEGKIRECYCIDTSNQLIIELKNEIFKYNPNESQQELRSLASSFSLCLENRELLSVIEIIISQIEFEIINENTSPQ